MLNLRDRIIEQSLILFDEYGFHGVTVKQIVEASKTSKGGFYHHFQSKDELLYVIHDAFITYVSKEAKRADETHRSPIDKIQEITRVFVRVFDLYKPHLSVFYQESKYLKPPYNEQIKQKRDEFKSLIFQVITEGQRTGHFRKELPPGLTSMAILGMVNWMYKWYRRDGDYSIDEIADVFIDIILHSLLPPDESAVYYENQMLHVPFFYDSK
ncbi:TetR/AcrR family transcriptional regulator [Halobacillus sp. A5]|uniref:TetR/AcrR family transcriptional regulator n=1 Tax=Halobacillus sp. A5 TaxID=2880263 RepID=UPI0020A67FE4|nr:TetR/AcrR family transcriptional regulator [Halobacillus sp. A5]MCP3025955.1 TetR/AcrR family transcriptional regulator [Halobacillus sp. A5]